MRKISINILLLLALLVSLSPNTAQAAPQPAGTTKLPILFGSYASGDLQTTIGEVTAMHNWLTKNGASGVTFAGDFMSMTLNPNWNVPHELDAAWDAGFVPFVNLMPSESWEGTYYNKNCVTSAQIAAGSCDGSLRLWADAFKAWAGSTKFAYLAPLPEVNGDWILYATDGPTYIKAFRRIQIVFAEQGVPDHAVEWVFAPNGWNDPSKGWQSFEYYYPGDAYVDVVAFSAYNYGGCEVNKDWQTWDTFEDGFEPYLQRMRVMAPSKPIFISQIGVTGVPDPDDPDHQPYQNKSAWTQDTFSKLANYPAVRAMIYFNKINTYETVGSGGPGCKPPDYRIFYGGSTGEAGFLSIMKDTSRFGRWTPTSSNWNNIAFNDPAYTFADVQPAHPFSGETNVWYYSAVHSLYNSGITGGCATNPLQYCPNDTVTRGQMAVFLQKGLRGRGFTPPDATGTRFNDVPSSYWAAAWIEQLASDSITGGCGNDNYCPEQAVTRAQMAVFLLKSKYGSSYNLTPLGPTDSTGFSDVPTNHWAAAWIKQLASEGITGGCGGGNYCPEQPVTRAQMAVFLVRTFSLP